MGGVGPARWKPAASRAELLLTQLGKTRLVLPAAIIFSRGSSLSSSPGSEKEMGEKIKEGENRVGADGTWVVVGDAHISPPSFLADRFGGRPG